MGTSCCRSLFSVFACCIRTRTKGKADPDQNNSEINQRISELLELENPRKIIIQNMKIQNMGNLNKRNTCDFNSQLLSNQNALYDILKPAKHFDNEITIEIVIENKNTRKKMEFKKVGLFNEGNTCYMNSVLQCFFHNDLLTDQILNQNKNFNEIAIEYRNTIKKYFSQDSIAMSVSSLMEAFEKSQKMNQFLYGRQMDSLEFMINLLTEMEDESLFVSNTFGLNLKNQLLCKKCKNVRGTSDEQFFISISCQPGANIYIYDCETNKKYEVYIGTFLQSSYLEILNKISKNFQQVKCYNDNDVWIDVIRKKPSEEEFKSKLLDKYNEMENSNQPLILILLNRKERIQYYNLDIINAAISNPLQPCVSLYDALLTHGKAEMMELPCKCGEEEIQQSLVFERINNYFIIKVNRKTFINTILEVPLKDLEMKYFFTEEKSKNKDSIKFHLFATIDHYGSTKGGHYVAKVLNEEEGKWYIFNDSSCYEEKEENVRVNRNSLILIYKKSD